MTPLQRALSSAALLALLFAPAQSWAQSPAPAAPAATPPAPASDATPSKSFDLADVHPSAHTLTPNFTGGALHGDRYLLHNATMVNLISLAYGIGNDNILSGPAWLDTDRFDVSAHAPSGTSNDDIKLMLQSLLAERFHLVLRKDSHPLPAFVLTVGKVGPKLKSSDGSQPSGCGDNPNAPKDPPGGPSYIYVSCHNLTADQIADNLRGMAGGYLTNQVVNQTGLTGAFDFDIKWTARNNLAKQGADGISIFDAVDKQLGLKLEAKTAPLPVLIVDKVDEKPTPNAPGIDKALPPPPPAEFDVAVLTPSKPDTRMSGDFTANQVKATGIPVKFFIQYAWSLNPSDDDLIQNQPKWLGQDHWDLVAKAAPEAISVGPDGKPQFDFDMLPHMVQTLLAERFQFKYHMEDRVIDAFTLVADNPRMKKADPLNRTGCKEGPGPDGKDPRVANPILGRLLYCQNMTMAQLADQLPNLANGYIFTPVLDSTHLTDAYDFTLSFSTAGQLRAPAPPPSGTQPTNDPNAAAEPNGALSLPDAMAKQLGVKLVKEKRPSPGRGLAHLEQTPTPN
ncbi:MAG: TIGR03435 family protein [Acidobacteriaceae bacterium]